MNFLIVALIIFLILESMNILTLYFVPGSRKGNGLGVFDAWEKSKEYPKIHELVKYLVYWVAGTKLIFVALLIVIIATGNRLTQVYSLIVLILSILSFFWRLFPMIRRMDAEGSITPKGYSKTLGVMIAAFILMFVVALIIAFL